MRRRRPPQDEFHNKERWLISYADFITLLFAFFVVMYSVSSVNEGKYKVLSNTLTGVFNAPERSVVPITVGDQPVAGGRSDTDSVIAPVVTETPPSLPAPDNASRSLALEELAGQLGQEFSALIEEGVISLSADDEWLQLNLPNSLLFGSANAEPHYDSFAVMEKIADVLRDTDNAIRIEGFTDNQSIRSDRFPSNWELSATRASVLVRMLVMDGIDPARLAAVGYGEHQPVARNDTDEGRRRNRRVVLLISRDASIRGAIR
ncbi:flagellar motor protein MotD [Marinobacter sp. BSs20148]|jgi:chemotaxis protein MotB|uniref:flagellar motor protein MotD n=1 Tax=Marinobacter TaxID=2742 RepID=UPI00059FA39C|nr:flagellar motor protein MotD [Marinobacter sp. BSs20148]